MALPEKRDELNRVDEQTALNRLDEQSGRKPNTVRVEEHHAIEDRQYREQRNEREANERSGHDFAKDVHPERYPRESLSRLEEGILDDDHKRHEHDHLGSTVPDLEDRIDDSRNLTRTLMVSGWMLFIFAWIVAWWVGWDVRSGNVFFSTMWIIGVIVGLGLIVWGAVEQKRVMGLLQRMRTTAALEKRRQIGAKREVRDGGRAA